MGLLNRLTRGAVSELGKSIGSKLGDALTDSLEKATGIDLDGSDNGTASTTSTASTMTASAAVGTSAPLTDAELAKMFDELLASDFSAYEVRKNASAQSLGITGAPCKDYDYALIKGGRTAAVIMLTPHNRDNNAAFKNAKANALKSNVAFINFYTHMDNERSYVSSRIKSFL